MRKRARPEGRAFQAVGGQGGGTAVQRPCGRSDCACAVFGQEARDLHRVGEEIDAGGGGGGATSCCGSP